MCDLCDPSPLPAGVRGDSLALGVLHAALLLGPAHPVELPADPLRPSLSGPGESRAECTGPDRIDRIGGLLLSFSLLRGRQLVSKRNDDVCFHKIIFAELNSEKSFLDTTCIFDLLH